MYIPTLWESSKTPTIAEWFRHLIKVVEMEELIHQANQRSKGQVVVVGEKICPTNLPPYSPPSFLFYLFTHSTHNKQDQYQCLETELTLTTLSLGLLLPLSTVFNIALLPHEERCFLKSHPIPINWPKRFSQQLKYPFWILNVPTRPAPTCGLLVVRWLQS